MHRRGTVDARAGSRSRTYVGSVAGNTSGENSETMGIGEVARRTGLSVHALRFYEREGLLVETVRRGPDGRRRYGADDLEWLEVCIKLRSSGMPLRAIRRYAELVGEGPGNEDERLALLLRHRDDVAAQIGALTSCLHMISTKVEIYQASVTDHSSDPIWAR